MSHPPATITGHMASQAPLLVGTERIIIDAAGMVVIPTRLLDAATLHHLTSAIPGVTLSEDGDTLTVDGAATPFAYPTLGQHLLDKPHCVDAMPKALHDRLHIAVARYAQAINASQAVGLAPDIEARWRAKMPPPFEAVARPYQVAAIDFIHTRCKGRGFLGDDPGGGKTAMSLSSVYVTEPRSLPAIVLCKATLKGNWVNEIAKWLGDDFKVCVLDGRTNLGDSLPHADFYLVNYEIIHYRLDDLLQVRPRALIVDESQMLKTVGYPDAWVDRYRTWEQMAEQAKAEDRKPPKKPKPPATGGAWRTWAAKKIAHHHTMQTVLLLSATPAPNGKAIEWLPQIDLLDRLDDLGGEEAFITRYARYCKDCVDEITGRVERTCTHRPYALRFGRRNDDGSINSAELATRLRSMMMIRRSQRQMYPHLPPIQPVPVELPMAASGIHPETGEKVNWRAEYVKAETEFVDWLKEHAGHKARAEGASVGRAVAQAVATSEGDYAKLVQLSHLRKIAAYSKMDVTIDYLTNLVGDQEENGQPRKVVIYAWHKAVQNATIDALQRWLDSPAGSHHRERLYAAYGGNYPGIPRLLSATTMTRDEIASSNQRFQEEPWEPFIVCSIAAAAEGFTLTAAWHVAHLESSTPAAYRQACGRIYGRANDSHGAMSHEIAVVDPKGQIETIEQRLWRALGTKRAIMANTLDDGQQREFENEPTSSDVMGDVFASYLA